MAHFRPSDATRALFSETFFNRLDEASMEELTLVKIRAYENGKDLWSGAPLVGLDALNNMRLKESKPELASPKKRKKKENICQKSESTGTSSVRVGACLDGSGVLTTVSNEFTLEKSL